MDRRKNPADKKISTTVYLTVDQEEKLRELGKRTRIPVSVFIREGIDMVLEKNQEVLSKQT